MPDLTQEETFELDSLALSLVNDAFGPTGKSQQSLITRINEVHRLMDLDRLRAYRKSGKLIVNLNYVDGAVDMLRADGIADTASLLTEEYLTAIRKFQPFPFHPADTEIMRLLLEDMGNEPILTHIVHNLKITDGELLRKKVAELRNTPSALIDGAL